ncbi:NACHT, LRR and PYD domains-containing protein 3 [Channa argus]|uniref:NACHT, LRR and PYD domains-containing protein 3 n=1 Tax=Channa argus TaxID=215402 RepID=A0A6G1Q323_CHAAH|nr:NACHT, LRR and PYD domains-containing protein 3 [Channa argus]
MDKETVLTHILNSKGMSTLLGGKLPANVITNNEYILPLTSEALVTDRNIDNNLSSLDQCIGSTLSGEVKTVILVGPEGSGKTTALQKLIVDWAKGEHLQNFSYVFYFRLREISSLEGMLSLETFMQQHQSHFPPQDMPLLLQKPEDALFLFDDLDQYRHSLDPSIHSLCSDPSQAVSVTCLMASLLHGSLLKGAAFLVATRPTACLEFLSGTSVELLGFLKPQREVYFNRFFNDQSAANKALMHMERTLGFYDFCNSPRFCWTICSIYKSLMDAGGNLPETLSQLYVDIMVYLIKPLSLSKDCNRDLVLALGRMASHCCYDQHPSCTREEMVSFGFQQFLSSVGVFLAIGGDLEHYTCVFSFHSQLMLEFILATCFFLDKSTSEVVEKMFEKHKGHTNVLDLFLSGLSEPIQHRPLETMLGEFNSDQVMNFKFWFKSSSEAALKGFYKDMHYRCFHLLHQAQNESLVKEIITSSALMGMSYGDLSLPDCVALSYVVTCLGEMKQLNLYHTRNLTEEKAQVLAPAMSLSHKIILSNSSLNPGAVPHLASALCRGITKELDLSHTNIGDEKFRSLCVGLRDCELHKLKLFDNELTGACCPYLKQALMSEHCSLSELDLSVNDLDQEGALLLCQALSRPGCPIEKLGLKRCELTQSIFKELGSLLRSGTSQLKSLIVGINKVGDQGVKYLWDAVSHRSCLLQELDVEMTDLTDACVEDVCVAIRTSKTLKSLEMRNNSLTDASVPVLVKVMQDSEIMQEMNLKYNNFSEDVFDTLEECKKIRY